MSTLLEDLRIAQEQFLQQMEGRDRTGEKLLPRPKTAEEEKASTASFESADSLVTTCEPQVSVQSYGSKYEKIYTRRCTFERAKRLIDQAVKLLFRHQKSIFQPKALSVKASLEDKLLEIESTLNEIENYEDQKDTPAIEILRSCCVRIEEISRNSNKEEMENFLTEIIGHYFAPVFRHQQALLRELKIEKLQHTQSPGGTSE
ncbi:coiled-coil domain-containing protein [Perkinsela sp. CCAP 1560/4]|nr:coiled-coil domain-containing protein [Perkinsela sp. CCAP 1560/4]|eukprot:KNH09435.1 coiled-coil domain-containing protein [Perkinsela sp. CCAP 1560/4]